MGQGHTKKPQVLIEDTLRWVTRDARCWEEGRSKMDKATAKNRNIPGVPKCYRPKTYCSRASLICLLHSLHLSCKSFRDGRRTHQHPVKNSHQDIQYPSSVLYLESVQFGLYCSYILKAFIHRIFPIVLRKFTAISVGKRSLHTEHCKAMKWIHKVCMFGICLNCQYKPTDIQNHSMKLYAIHKTSYG